MTTADYNYRHFDVEAESGREAEEFAAFAGAPHAGDPAPDFAAVRLEDHETVRASSLWRGSPVVVEFGSFT